VATRGIAATPIPRSEPPIAIPPSLLVAAAVAAAALVGAAMARDVQLGVAATAALVFAPLSLINLPIAIVCWLPTVSLIALAALNVGPNLAAMMIAFAWLGSLAGRDPRTVRLLVEHRSVLTMTAALVLWMLLSMAWAPEPRVGSDLFFGWVVAGAIVLILATTLTTRGHLKLAIGAFIAGVVVSVAVGVLGGAVQEGSDRIVGGSGDPNFLAAGIVPAMVLAFGLAASSRRGWVKLAVAGAIALLTIGLLTTGSRGGFIAAIVALVAVLVLTKRRRAWVVAMILLMVGVAGAAISVDSAAWERITDLSESSGRSELWTVAWQVWQDHPAVGVGFQGFVDHASTYARELGPLEFSEFLAEEPKLVHNSYLELLAEAGVIGLGLFIAVAVACLRRTWLAVRGFEAQGDEEMGILARSLIAATVALLAAGFFISGSTDRRLWVLFALGPALAACAAERERRGASPEAGSAAPVRRIRRGARPLRTARPPA
jgi:O-antigen ligase